MKPIVHKLCEFLITKKIYPDRFSFKRTRAGKIQKQHGAFSWTMNCLEPAFFEIKSPHTVKEILENKDKVYFVETAVTIQVLINYTDEDIVENYKPYKAVYKDRNHKS
ncbi:MAG: hypothetical protein HPY57_12745 [Ignavibacteria bacterium]|nr:hypothetical protein [Ignavibacteria bacterium]